MAGPTLSLNIDPEMLLKLGDMKKAAQTAAAEIRAIEKAALKAEKAGKDLDDATKARLKKFEEVERRAKASIAAEEKLTKTMEREERSRRANAKREASKRDAFDDFGAGGREGRATLRNLRGIESIARGLSKGDFSSIGLADIKDALELGEMGTSGALKGAFSKTLAALPAVAGAALYAKFAYDLVAEPIDQANKFAVVAGQTQTIVNKQLGKGAFDRLNNFFLKNYGAQVPGSEKHFERLSQIRNLSDDVDALAKDPAFAMQLLKSAKLFPKGALLRDAGIDLSGVRGGYGLRAALTSEAGDAESRRLIINVVKAKIEERANRERDQKEAVERLEEQDPSYAPRMRQRDRWFKAVEADMMMKRQDWNPY